MSAFYPGIEILKSLRRFVSLNLLIKRGSLHNHKVKHYKNFKACKKCPLRAQCTNAKLGRLIERSIYQEALERNQQRVNENPDYYRFRQQITEHQFGTLKRQWGFTFTLMKGKQHVLSEVNLVMICYNLRRLMSIFGVNELKNRLKGLFAHVFQLYEAFLAIFSLSFWEVYFLTFIKQQNLNASMAFYLPEKIIFENKTGFVRRLPLVPTR